MKNLLFLGLFLLLVIIAPAQKKIEPCDKWLTDFIQKDPKVSDGTSLNKYVVEKLQGDTSLKSKATCMVGLRIYVNCKGEFSYEKEGYPNKDDLTAQCNKLLLKVDKIMNSIKAFTPGMMDGNKKDFIFKLVVKVEHDGKATAEVLY